MTDRYLFTGTVSREPFPERPQSRRPGIAARVIVFVAAVLTWAAASGYVGVFTYPP